MHNGETPVQFSQVQFCKLLIVYPLTLHPDFYPMTNALLSAIAQYTPQVCMLIFIEHPLTLDPDSCPLTVSQYTPNGRIFASDHAREKLNPVNS